MHSMKEKGHAAYERSPETKKRAMLSMKGPFIESMALFFIECMALFIEFMALFLSKNAWLFFFHRMPGSFSFHRMHGSFVRFFRALQVSRCDDELDCLNTLSSDSVLQPIADRVAQHLEIISKNFQFCTRRIPGFSWDSSCIIWY